MLVEDIAKLWDLDRVEVWNFYLKRELTPVQQTAIIDAHNVWKNRGWAWINNYNQDEIMQKTRILQEAWFNKEERRILLEKWVCWKEFVWLYNNPDYRFLQWEEYSNVREFLWDIDTNDVIWEWVNAIIVEHPNDPTKIVKIWRPKKDNIIKEVESHDRCVDALNELKDNPKYNIDDNIKIPEITLWATDNFYTMDKIQWHSFKTKFYIEKYWESLNWLLYTKEKLQAFSDNQVEQILRKNRYQALQKPSEPTYIQTPREKNLEIEYLEWWDKKYKSEELAEARRVLDLLKSEKGIDVQDRNPWNFMQTTDWKTYLIDFWLIK